MILSRIQLSHKRKGQPRRGKTGQLFIGGRPSEVHLTTQSRIEGAFAPGHCRLLRRRSASADACGNRERQRWVRGRQPWINGSCGRGSYQLHEPKDGRWGKPTSIDCIRADRGLQVCAICLSEPEKLLSSSLGFPRTVRSNMPGGLSFVCYRVFKR